MRRLRLDRPASPGATLARDVTGSGGEIIARAGYALTERARRALTGRGVSWCFVEDAWGEGILVSPLPGGHGTVRPLLREFEQRLADLVAPLVTLSTQKALEALRRTRPTAPLVRTRCVEEMPVGVAAFIEACDAADAAGGWLVDRDAAEDEAGHAIGVAAVAARIARLLGLDAAERHAVVIAGLVHDAGMVFVPRAVRMTPHVGRSIPERTRYEDHAILGEAVLAPLGGPALLSLVAGEHHEAADGSGYPRKRAGGHRVLRTAEEQGDPDRIALASEIVAVADAYERAVSPSAGYAGRSPGAARVVLEERAGRTLNREIVHRFLASYPALPLGTEVRVSRGEHQGTHGIVSGLPRASTDATRVRLYLDALGRPIDPVEVELPPDAAATVEIADAA